MNKWVDGWRSQDDEWAGFPWLERCATPQNAMVERREAAGGEAKEREGAGRSGKERVAGNERMDGW